MKNPVSDFEQRELHIIDVPTNYDIDRFITGYKIPENVTMLVYWMKAIHERAEQLGIMGVFYEDVVFLGAIEWKWFCEELERDK